MSEGSAAGTNVDGLIGVIVGIGTAIGILYQRFRSARRNSNNRRNGAVDDDLDIILLGRKVEKVQTDLKELEEKVNMRTIETKDIHSQMRLEINEMSKILYKMQGYLEKS